ncbi:MAG: hypothetical protein JWR36_2683 [Glaciihabitans sp.]|jgi:hypothetical protein|nr:hypothetical protein [Glaciihabitans sp.]MDQ1570955.1 hypothetical protein [Actinomycetota bacterium]
MTRRAIVDVVTTLVGSGLVLSALVIIWIARLTIPRDIYVSELGATGMPTARTFEIALLLIVAGGSLIAFAGRNIRSRVRILAAWTPAVSLWIACGFFLVASQVTCTSGCPLPYGSTFDWQDLTHITCATFAFVAACWAMLQTALAENHRTLARFSLWTGVAVGVIAGVGGLCSLTNFQANFGSRLELVATTLAIAWVAVLGVSIAARRLRAHRPDIRASRRLASPTSM